MTSLWLCLLCGLLTANASVIREKRQTSGITVNATCDNEMELYVDGVEVAKQTEWTSTTSVTVPADTAVIGIECVDLHVVAGILASLSNNLVTDKSWKCSPKHETGWSLASFDDSSWTQAYEIGPNGMSPWSQRPGISTAAKWIWTGSNTWRGVHKNVYCRLSLKKDTWGDWSKWSPCSGNCEEGFQGRKRMCIAGNCTGESTQTRTCSHCSSSFNIKEACKACDFNDYYHNLVPDPCDCRGYYSCQNIPLLGWTGTRQSCSNCTVFDVEKQTCVYDGVSIGGCEEVINEEKEEVSPTVCRVRNQGGRYVQMFGVSTDRSSYVWYIDNSLTGRQVTMNCAAGTHFDLIECGCIHGGIIPKARELVCLDFDTKSYGQLVGSQNIYVKAENIGYQPGKVGSAGSFNGINSEIEIPFFMNQEFTKGFSVSFWFKRHSAGGAGIMGLISMGDCHNNVMYHVTSTGSALLSAGAVTLNGLAHDAFVGKKAADDDWHHVVLSYDNKHLELFVDKVSQGLVPLSGNLRMPLCPMRLGSIFTGGTHYFLNGLMDEVCFWGKGLTKDEVAAL